MRRKRSCQIITMLLLPFIWMQTIFNAPAQSGASSPPKTRVENTTDNLHGVAVADPYRWLEDQESAETRAWIDAQNRYTQGILGSIAGRDALQSRLTQLLKIDEINLPLLRNNRYFFTKRLANQNQLVIYMRQGFGGKDEVLIDANKMSDDQRTSVSIVAVSEDGKLLAYNVRQGGEDETTRRIMNVDTRQDLPDQLPRARYYGFALLPDASGVYYSKAVYAGAGKREPLGSRVYYHQMGTDAAGDKEIFGAGYSPTEIINPSVSLDGRYLIIHVFHGSSGSKTDIFVQDLKEKSAIVAVVKDVDSYFFAQFAGGHLYLTTNWQAPNRRLMEVDLKNPAREHWREVVPEGKFVMEAAEFVGGKIFVSYLENVTSRIKIFDVSGKPAGEIAFPTVGSASPMIGRWNADEAFYSFNSFAQPSTIYRYQVSTGKQDVWARQNVPVNSAEIETKQVWYESKDKTRIPMFLVYKKGTKLDGQRPVLLTGYGGFNVSLTPDFDPTAALWAEHGGVFAMPNLRGGGEFGEKWHQSGMLDKKQNVFDDFIAAAEWLIKNNYTRPSRLAIDGGSNGGLLVGAAMTQRPELFQAVVCSYPLLDMVRYHRFLVARFWVPEYGSADDPQQFPFIYRYSPYHHVTAGTKYPAVLFITGDSDTRVAPLHARKMAALVQSATASDRPVLLHYDTKAGHSGGTPVSKQIEDLTDELSFLFWQLGVQMK